MIVGQDVAIGADDDAATHAIFFTLLRTEEILQFWRNAAAEGCDLMPCADANHTGAKRVGDLSKGIGEPHRMGEILVQHWGAAGILSFGVALQLFRKCQNHSRDKRSHDHGAKCETDVFPNIRHVRNSHSGRHDLQD